MIMVAYLIFFPIKIGIQTPSMLIVGPVLNPFHCEYGSLVPLVVTPTGLGTVAVFSELGTDLLCVHEKIWIWVGIPAKFWGLL